MACADRLIAAGVARVAIACEDPSLKAAGRGLERMRAAGIAVTMGLLADEAQVLCEGFLHRERTGRPLVAESADGSGFEARFAPQPGEAPEAALFRLGREGFTRLWVPAGGVEAKALEARPDCIRRRPPEHSLTSHGLYGRSGFDATGVP